MPDTARKPRTTTANTNSYMAACEERSKRRNSNWGVTSPAGIHSCSLRLSRKLVQASEKAKVVTAR